MPEFSESPFLERTSMVNSEFQQSIEARLDRKQHKIIVDDEKHRDQLRNRGFGEKENGDHVLRSYEALYLSYTKKLIMRETMTA